MNSPNSAVTDLVAETGVNRQSVESRIARRLEVLRQWLREGVPAGKTVPKNLKAARIWDDQELGIEPIASPNEFTTTHHLHGRSVSDVGKLLTELKNLFGKPQEKPISAAAKVAKFDRNAFDRLLEDAVSQWHSERDLRLQEKRRADSADARSILLLGENNQKDELITDLRRQLAARKGPRAVR